jgi:cyanate lyase
LKSRRAQKGAEQPTAFKTEQYEQQVANSIISNSLRKSIALQNLADKAKRSKACVMACLLSQKE